MISSLIITTKGLEPCVQKELLERFNLSSEIRETAVLFKAKSEKQLAQIAYYSQSAHKVIHLLADFQFKNIDDIITQVKKAKLPETKTFRIDCQRIGNHDFSSLLLRQSAAEIINGAVDFKNPDTIFYFYIYNNNCYFGIDTAKIDISKRDYKIFSYGLQLKGTTAFSLLMFSGYKKTDSLFIPFCSSGIIPIEAALFSSNKSNNFFRKDKFFFTLEDSPEEKPGPIFAFDPSQRSIEQAEKNAKIAGVAQLIHFQQPFFLVDKIVAFPPPQSQKNSANFIQNVYNNFFAECEKFLKPDSTVTFLVKEKQLPISIAEKHGFKAKEAHEIFIGPEKWIVIILKKSL